MYLGNNIIFPFFFLNFNPNINIFPFFTGNNLININQFNSLNNNPNIFLPSTILPKQESNENNKNEEKKIYFKVIHPQKESLFTKTNIDKNEEKEEKINIHKKLRSKIRRPRKYNNDNIRRKIKRIFLNNALIKKLNDKLKNIGSINTFKKFPQYFASDIDQKRNKKILNMTLKEIFEKEELYKYEKEIGKMNYEHNKNIIQKEEIKENEEFNKILNKTFRELYEEYINSDEFKIGEINRLRNNKKMNDDYIKRYLYLSKYLIEFLNQ